MLVIKKIEKLGALMAEKPGVSSLILLTLIGVGVLNGLVNHGVI